MLNNLRYLVLWSINAKRRLRGSKLSVVFRGCSTNATTWVILLVSPVWRPPWPAGAAGMGGGIAAAEDGGLDFGVVLIKHFWYFSDFLDVKSASIAKRGLSRLEPSSICTLYDVGHQDGIDYLVMEFLEETRWPIGW